MPGPLEAKGKELRDKCSNCHERRSRVPGMQPLRSYPRLGMHARSPPRAHPVRVLCRGAGLRTGEQKEKPAPSG